MQPELYIGNIGATRQLALNCIRRALLTYDHILSMAGWICTPQVGHQLSTRQHKSRNILLPWKASTTDKFMGSASEESQHELSFQESNCQNENYMFFHGCGGRWSLAKPSSKTNRITAHPINHHWGMVTDVTYYDHNNVPKQARNQLPQFCSTANLVTRSLAAWIGSISLCINHH